MNAVNNLRYRKAEVADLRKIIELLMEDELGKERERLGEAVGESYLKAFEKINQDEDQYLMVVELKAEIVGTCHLMMIDSLTFQGSRRMEIEAVRVAEKHRGEGIGEWMIEEALDWGRARSAKIVQLTTNKTRFRAKEFYERLGFEATHEGMKMNLKPLALQP